jgi:hypothetical protein
MQSRIAIVSCVIACLLGIGIAGCGDSKNPAQSRDDTLVGIWESSSRTYVFMADGTFREIVRSVFGGANNFDHTGSWRTEGKLKLILTFDGDRVGEMEELNYSVKGDTLTLVDTNSTSEFERK